MTAPVDVDARTSRDGDDVGLPGERRLTPPLTRQRLIVRVVIVGFLAGCVWSWWYLGLSITDVVVGVDELRNLLDRMLPPDFVDLSEAIRLSFETLFMAVIGTSIAVVLSVPLAFGAARNTAVHPAVVASCRAIITAGRAIPDLVFAFIFVRAFGIGVLPGVLALGLHSVGMIGKLFADQIEQIDETPREAVTSVGAGKWRAITTSVMPQVFPGFIGTALYRLDINFRSAAVLGFVGAGGIGLLLNRLFSRLHYDRVLGVVIIVFLFITVIEFASAAVRQHLIGTQSTRRAPRASLGARLAPGPRGDTYARPTAIALDRSRVTPPWTRERRLTAGYVGGFAALLLLSLWFTRINPIDVATAVPDIARIGGRMIPPDFSTARSGMISGVTETLAMSFLSTLFGVVLSVPLGILAARNATVNRGVYVAARLLMLVVRGVPELMFVIIVIVAMGGMLGPVPGIVALSVGATGFLAKLVADSIEEIDPAPREAVLATGATRLQDTFVSVIPQAMPALIGSSLYMWDINIRLSTILGFVGAGGIGVLLMNSIRVQHWPTTAAIMITIFAVVSLIELIAGWVRKQII